MWVDAFTIREFGARAEVTPDTLRYYERLDLLHRPARTRGGYRLYDPTALERVAFIRRLTGQREPHPPHSTDISYRVEGLPFNAVPGAPEQRATSQDGASTAYSSRIPSPPSYR